MRSTARSSTAAGRRAGPRWRSRRGPSFRDRRPRPPAGRAGSRRRWRRGPSGGEASRAPGAAASRPRPARGPERAAARTASATALAVPSIVFSTTLPVKPSVTTRRHRRPCRSRPSTLPMKSTPSAVAEASRSPRPPRRSPSSAPRRPTAAPTRGLLDAEDGGAERGRRGRRTGPGRLARASVFAPTSRSRSGRPGAARDAELQRQRGAPNALHAPEREQRRGHRGAGRAGAGERVRAPLGDVGGGADDRGLARASAPPRPARRRS